MSIWERWRGRRQDRAERDRLRQQESAAFCYVTNAQLKEMLDRQVTPLLAAEGFLYDGGYVWFGPWEEHCRRVVRVYLLKGAAIFQWGLCFDFLPVFNWEGRNLHYQRTDKSVGLQLFTWPEGHWQQPPSRHCRFRMFGTGPEEVECQIGRAFGEAQAAFHPWFREAAGLAGALEEAQRQAAAPRSYNWPQPGYVLAFLLAANGRPEEGETALETFLTQWEERGGKVSDQLREALKKKLRSCGDLRADSAEKRPGG